MWEEFLHQVLVSYRQNPKASFMGWTGSFMLKLLFHIIPSYPSTELALNSLPCKTSQGSQACGSPQNLPQTWNRLFSLPGHLHHLTPREPLLSTQAWLQSLRSWESLCLLSSCPLGRVSHSLSGLEPSRIHSSSNTSLVLFMCLSPQ